MRAGNADLILVSTGGLLGTTQVAHQVTNRFILKGMAALEYDAIGMQGHDLVYGLEVLTAQQLPWVATNWSRSGGDNKQPALISSALLVERGSLTVGFLNWFAPQASQQHSHAAMQGQYASDLQVLEKQLRALKAQSVFTIVAANGTEQSLTKLPLELIDVLLLSASDENYLTPEKDGQTWIIRAGTRGQRLGHLTLSSEGYGAWELKSHEVIELDETVPDAKRLDTWYEQYESALVQDYNVREQQAKKTLADGHYVGDKMCGLCHSNQKVQWEITEHARAYQSLLAVSKQFDANCVACHVVGFGQPGGFSSALAKPDLRNVGCEACHGPAKAHQLNGGTAPLSPVTVSVCTSCHTIEHSPNFDPEDYWAQTIHQRSSRKK